MGGTVSEKGTLEALETNSSFLYFPPKTDPTPPPGKAGGRGNVKEGQTGPPALPDVALVWNARQHLRGNRRTRPNPAWLPGLPQVREQVGGDPP